MKKLYQFSDIQPIVRNRTTLARWIKERGFPSGFLLGPNVRAWDADTVDRWVEARRAQHTAQEAA